MSRRHEVVEAVKLLTDLKKPVQMICRQLDIMPEIVVAIVATGKFPGPPEPRSLFDANEVTIDS